jgi:hypothetical protein
MVFALFYFQKLLCVFGILRFHPIVLPDKIQPMVEVMVMLIASKG